MKSAPEKLSVDDYHEKLARYPLVILESQLEGHPASKCSYVAAKPKRSITAYGSTIEVMEEGDKRTEEQNPWDALKSFQAENKTWLFGFLGYDLKNFVEDLNSSNPPLADMPELYFMEPEVLLKFSGSGVEFLKGDPESLESSPSVLPGSVELDVKPLIEKKEYLRYIETIQNRIEEGDFYEMNYTFPLCGSYLGDPYWLYSGMREINPVPFGAYISDEKYAVCCASPERFLKKDGLNIQSQPIKGTAARSWDLEVDNINRRELLNEKNRAENLMIVDLVRHDLSAVSKPGSVQVSNLYDVQTFGTVHQLISTVESVAREDVGPIEIIRSCFPMGSMTGAPKIAAMKAIEELEIYRRGIYSGAIGYITPDDDFDFNVVIRTAIIQGESLFYPAGGAITSDSVPESEWEEALLKSKNITDMYSNAPNL